jgi:hypothetical protein
LFEFYIFDGIFYIRMPNEDVLPQIIIKKDALSELGNFLIFDKDFTMDITKFIDTQANLNCFSCQSFYLRLQNTLHNLVFSESYLPHYIPDSYYLYLNFLQHRKIPIKVILLT